MKDIDISKEQLFELFNKACYELIRVVPNGVSNESSAYRKVDVVILE
jgi:hypothetical protein